MPAGAFRRPVVRSLVPGTRVMPMGGDDAGRGRPIGPDLINPHSWIFMEVPGEGEGAEPTLWAMEATTPVGLRRNGIEPDDVRPGDLIRVRCHRLRDGSDGCLLGFVTPLHGDPERGHGIEKEWD